jgi:hypothetical protein
MAAANSELETLRVEVTELRRQVVDAEVERGRQGHGGRRVVVGLLILLGCILFAGANVTFWLRDTVLNTNGWLAAVGPLSKSPVVVDAVSDLVVQELQDAIDFELLAQEIVPEQYSGFSGPVAVVLRNLIHEAVATVIQSDPFNDVWRAANRTVHKAVVAVLRGEGTLIYVREGQVTVDLSDLVLFVENALDVKGLDKLVSEEFAKFVLFSDDTLAALQRAVALLDTVGLLLPLLALACFVAGWFLSVWRRRTVSWIGVGLAITMGISLILFAVVQPLALSYIPDLRLRTVADEIAGIVLEGLYIQTGLLLILGLLITLGAWLAGPHPWAVWFRTSVRESFGRGERA